jgi:hypothetical protein
MSFFLHAPALSIFFPGCKKKCNVEHLHICKCCNMDFVNKEKSVAALLYCTYRLLKRTVDAVFLCQRTYETVEQQKQCKHFLFAFTMNCIQFNFIQLYFENGIKSKSQS